MTDAWTARQMSSSLSNELGRIAHRRSEVRRGGADLLAEQLHLSLPAHRRRSFFARYRVVQQDDASIV